MSKFTEPKIKKNYQNEIRSVGFELEFSNIDIEQVLNILEKEFNFEINKVNNYYYELNSEYGKFTLELDFELLTKQKLKKGAKDLSRVTGINIDQKDIESIEKLIAKFSKDIVPYEISTPPLPLTEIDMVENIVQKLSKNNAKGTTYKIYNAFGLHINVEVISLDTDSLLAYLRAYVILQDFINKDAKVNLARKITPFIDNFKSDYIKYILDLDYTPSISEFIKDYIKFNPTRNRSLDMLPILCFIDEQTVRGLLPDEKIKPRPAFHYRLSNSKIGEKNWRVSDEWDRWILVENLANNEEALKQLSKEYIEYLDSFVNLDSWEKKVSRWLKNHS
jgi:hypothetical protein